MPTYVFAYHGGPKFESPDQGAKYMASWRTWVASLGDAMTGPSTYFGLSMSVGPQGRQDDSGANPLSGISMIQADSIEAALEMAQQSPHVNHGTIEVAEVMEMPE